VIVHRAELQQLLAAELDPAVIHLGARCTGFEDSGQAVMARFADGRKVRADVLVGADGVHSAVRAKMFGPAPLPYRGYTAVRSLTPAGSVPPPSDSTET
jgi:2-polyprenyl-6-methoxyphenol hydroxylase-like FAD-dependent oxidoreductase